MTHLQLVPDPHTAPVLELTPHDGTPCPRCTSTNIPHALGLNHGTGRICRNCTEDDDPELAAAIDAIDTLDQVIACTPAGRPTAVITALIAEACAHVIESHVTEEDTRG